MWFFFKTYWILWQNARNLRYIMWHNDEIAKKLADSKLKTKDFLQKKWVKIVRTLLIISKHDWLNESIFENLDTPFVIKPNSWYWGKWIIIIETQDSLWNYITKSWKSFSKKKLLSHFSDIIDWFYSLSWVRDKVIIEKKIILNREIELLWKYWLPDIRLIVFNRVPVMAMLRVPTESSWWKANLHAWACWVWVDIWTWKLTYTTRYWKIIKSIPWIWDVKWITVPLWNELLTLAVKIQYVTWVWYLWCDIVLDDIDGPLLLEMNIRAWLEVQIANMAPLKERLEKVWKVNINSVDKWVRLWRDLFWWDIEERIKNLSWKKVLWTKEYITINYNKKSYKYLADIKLSKDNNYIDLDFAQNILKIDIWDSTNKSISAYCLILWEKRVFKFYIKKLHTWNVLIWMNSLRWFLIDPYKYRKWEMPISEDIEFLRSKNKAINKTYDEQISKIDSALVSIDKKLVIWKHLTPLNINEEREKFIESKWEYDPQLVYREPKFNLDDLSSQLKQIDIPDIPLWNIYNSKKKEIQNKINFLKALDWNNFKDSIFYWKKIYWDINSDNIEKSNQVLEWIWKVRIEQDFTTEEEVRWYINKFNHIYWIKINLEISDKSARFMMKWDKLIMRDWALIWKKEIRAIIAHEIEWHYLRKINWRKLRYSIFSHWSTWYLPIDEWIAIYNQNRFITDIDKKYYSIYERYFFVNYALKTSYKKLLHKMREYYDEDYEKIFNFMLRIKKWYKNFSNDGVFVRDVVYLNWFMEVESYLSNWWSLVELYVWKISIEDLKILKDSYILKIDFADLKTPFFL